MQQSHCAYLLHQRPYKETSAIINTFTQEFGRMNFVVKGVHNNRGKVNKWQFLQPFNLLQLSWVGRSDLKTLTQCDLVDSPRQLTGNRLYSGLYLNELIYHLLKPFDVAPKLFSSYHQTIAQLSAKPIEPLLRQFELVLLNETGFGINLKYQQDGELINLQQHYHFVPEMGFVEAANGIQGSCLLGIAEGRWDNSAVLASAKKLLRPIINQLLQGRELKSRKLFIKQSQVN